MKSDMRMFPLSKQITAEYLGDLSQLCWPQSEDIVEPSRTVTRGGQQLGVCYWQAKKQSHGDGQDYLNC